MKIIAKIMSAAGLALTVLPAFFVLAHRLDVSTYQNLMLTGTLLWLLSAPIWMFRAKTAAND